MPRAALQPDDISVFRRRAVDAAMQLFARQGYDAVTMRAVGAALGVSAMTSYRYVRDKDELFALVRAEAFRRFADRLEAALARGGGDALARLARLKRAYVRFAVDEPDAYRIMFELRQPDRLAAPELLAESRRSFGALYRTVGEAIDEGLLEGDALTVAHLLWASTHGLVALHLAGKLTMGRSLTRLTEIDHELGAFRTSKNQAPRARRSKTP